MPLRSAGAKVEVKPTPIENVASPVTPLGKPSQPASMFATVQEISDNPSEGSDMPELVSPRSPTSSESSLSSLDGSVVTSLSLHLSTPPRRQQTGRHQACSRCQRHPLFVRSRCPPYAPRRAPTQPLHSRRLSPSLSLRQLLLRRSLARTSRRDSILQRQSGLQLPILTLHLQTTCS